MKKAILAFAGLLASVTVHASLIEQYTAELTHFQMQDGSGLELVDVGNVFVTPLTNSIHLSLGQTHRIFCVTAPCPQPVNPVFSVNAKIVDIKTGECGETIYVAKEDLRRVDGALTEVQVIDNTNYSCPTKRPIGATTVTLKIESLRGNQQFHLMSGSNLSLVM